jgi:lipopolysaccharide/colanic/teichoic acid biosynthesis glycosyltransferase
MISKRVLDFVMALSGLVFFAPVFLTVAFMLKLCDRRGSVFFVQPRIGQKGRPFFIYKFRSMHRSPQGPAITVGNDPRITGIGRVLRRTKLDELPQLWNVLRGDMSFVGPRPEVAKYVAFYSESQREVLRLRPGITDPASFAFYEESDLLAKADDPEGFYRDILIPEKIRINLEYASQATLLKDLYLILATVLKGFGVQVDVFKYLAISEPKVPELT